MTRAVVTCLHCRQQYAPRRGGLMVMQNNACPRCGYVGWSYVEARLATAKRVAAPVSAS
jgi:DNA-directed RNA polymerase subunit RPC12/RpoP